MFEIFQCLMPFPSLGDPSEASLFRLASNSFKDGVAKVWLPLSERCNSGKLFNLDFPVNLVRSVATETVGVLATVMVTGRVFR